MDLKKYIRSIPDYPKKGILFRDITTLIKDKDAFKNCINQMSKILDKIEYDKIAGIESRGFIFASPLSYNLSKPNILMRKKNKLPAEKYSEDFELEYGKATLEIHKDSIQSKERIVIVDDLIATGDVANKIGTYLKALAAKDNNVPFYVALPSSTIDWETTNFKNIPIEERNSEELSHVEGLDENNNIKKILIYPKKSKAMNLAFDVTPAKYVTGLITEKGVCEASEKGLKELFK